MKQLIYLDNAATTKTRLEVVGAMLLYFTEYYDNPPSAYDFPTEGKKTANHVRETIAQSLGAKISKIYFTTGDSKANNWTLAATAEAYGNKGKHIITTKIEHHAILHACQYPEKRGYEVAYLDVDENGVVKPDRLKRVIRPDIILTSVMFANNEISAIEPIKEVGVIARENGILFHADVVQALVHVPIRMDEHNINTLSSSGHKLNGLKGIGFPYTCTSVRIRSFTHGGAQECKYRTGTENMPGIVGCGEAVELVAATVEEWATKETQLRDYLMGRAMSEVFFTRVNGSHTGHLPDSANLAFRFIEDESLPIKLGMAGICGSSGSACISGSLDLSHVLLIIGLPHGITYGPLRLTLSKKNTEEETDYVVKQIEDIVGYLRSISPSYEDCMRHSGSEKK